VVHALLRKILDPPLYRTTIDNFQSVTASAFLQVTVCWLRDFLTESAGEIRRFRMYLLRRRKTIAITLF